MKAQLKNLDTIQIVGFLFSTLVSIGLLIAGQDTVTSITLGLVLAAVIQLFDMQKRHSDSEERLLKASALSQALYTNEPLLKSINQIVSSYLLVRSRPFELFKDRADYLINQCQEILNEMANGHLEAEQDSSWIFSRRAFEQAQKCLKATVLGNVEWWRKPFAQRYFEQNVAARKRGIEVTRVFIEQTDKLRGATDILEKQRSEGIKIYVVEPEVLSQDLLGDYLIMDDQVVITIKLGRDGKTGNENISINDTEVKQAVMQFDMLVRLAKEVDDEFINQLKQRRDGE